MITVQKYFDKLSSCKECEFSSNCSHASSYHENMSDPFCATLTKEDYESDIEDFIHKYNKNIRWAEERQDKIWETERIQKEKNIQKASKRRATLALTKPQRDDIKLLIREKNRAKAIYQFNTAFCEALSLAEKHINNQEVQLNTPLVDLRIKTDKICEQCDYKIGELKKEIKNIKRQAKRKQDIIPL